MSAIILHEVGLRTIGLADPAGHAPPAPVERLFGEVLRLDPGVELAAHFHNTYGLGMANIYAARRAGAVFIETSFARLGGCPFTKVAAGNVATEDLVHALQLAGEREDVDLEKLCTIAREVAELFAQPMPGFILQTGPIRGATT